MSLKPARFLDPKVDVVFKKIFGNNPDLMKSFLNGLLPLPDDGLIESLTYLTPEQSPRIPTMKNTIVDVKCTDQKGRIFIVEMQLHWSDSFTKRLLFGSSKAYVQQLAKGEDYQTLCPVYGLGLINAIFDHETPAWFHHYKMVNVKNPDRILSGLELVFLELPKFIPQSFEHRRMGVLWLRFLREINEKLTEIPPEFDAVPELRKAMELAQESAFNPAELDAYDRYWDAVHVENTIKKDALLQGLQEGRQEGLQEGIEKGRLQEKKAIAVSMLQNQLPLDVIQKISGLSLEDIEKLKNS